jgi:hypothetical protein
MMDNWMERANDSFERRLKTDLPLDMLLTETVDEPLDAAAMEKMAKAAAEQPNIWPVEAAFDIAKGEQSEDAPVRYFDLAIDERDPLRAMVEKAVRQELKRHASSNEADEEEEEPEETQQLPEDRGGTRLDRDVARMAASIAFKVAEEGMTRDEAVASLRKCASSDYSRQVIDQAVAA